MSKKSSSLDAKLTNIFVKKRFEEERKVLRFLIETHRHTRKHSNAPTTVSIGHNITIAHTQKGNSNEPHGVEQICMFLIVISDVTCV